MHFRFNANYKYYIYVLYIEQEFFLYLITIWNKISFWDRILTPWLTLLYHLSYFHSIQFSIQIQIFFKEKIINHTLFLVS